jgi:hypothetical protein
MFVFGKLYRPSQKLVGKAQKHLSGAPLLGRLLTLQNIRLGMNGFPGKLDFYKHSYITVVKSFIKFGPGGWKAVETGWKGAPTFNWMTLNRMAEEEREIERKNMHVFVYVCVYMCGRKREREKKKDGKNVHVRKRKKIGGKRERKA